MPTRRRTDESNRRHQCLTRAEVDFYVENGYLGPYAAMTPAEMTPIRQAIESHVLNTAGPNPRRPMQSRHMDIRLSTTWRRIPPSSTASLACWGRIWSSRTTNFWLKEPGGAEIPWHQDINFWPIEPPVNISAWIAIDHVTVENSCLQIIPGSHRQFVPHARATEEMAIAEMADPQAYDVNEAVNMELRPGEFFLFSERLLHTSSVNASDQRRLGLAIRVTLPIVHIFQDSHLHPGHTAILASGKDVMGFNRYAGRPAL